MRVFLEKCVLGPGERIKRKKERGREEKKKKGGARRAMKKEGKTRVCPRGEGESRSSQIKMTHQMNQSMLKSKQILEP